MDQRRTELVVRQAVDLGINLVDTSNNYSDGLCETYIGKAIEDIRDKVVLATKVASRMGPGPNEEGASRKHIMGQVEGSLRRLNTDYLDLYQIHHPDPKTAIEETLRALNDLVRQGKVRYVGCSNFSAWQVAQSMEVSRSNGFEPFVSVQPEYNILSRGAERELVPCCRAYGLGILPYHPLDSGFLTGKYRRGETPPEGTRFAFAPQIAQRMLTCASFDVLERLESFAADRGRSIIELAFGWLLASPVVSSVIAGVSNREQVVVNAGSADWRVTSAEFQELDGILSGPE